MQKRIIDYRKIACVNFDETAARQQIDIMHFGDVIIRIKFELELCFGYNYRYQRKLSQVGNSKHIILI